MVLDYQMTQMPEVTVIMMIRLIGALESSWGAESPDPHTRLGKPFTSVVSPVWALRQPGEEGKTLAPWLSVSFSPVRTFPLN